MMIRSDFLRRLLSALGLRGFHSPHDGLTARVLARLAEDGRPNRF